MAREKSELELLSIGEVAEATGLRPSALRYYEEAGLIRPATRVGGRRHYQRSVLRTLAIVAHCQEVGFTIGEIAELVGTGGGRGWWREVAERKLADLEVHIARATAIRRILQEALACGCGDPASCGMVADAAQRRVLSLERPPGRARGSGPPRSLR